MIAQNIPVEERASSDLRTSMKGVHCLGRKEWGKYDR